MATESTTWWYYLNNNVSLKSYTKEELNGLLDNNTIPPPSFSMISYHTGIVINFIIFWLKSKL